MAVTASDLIETTEICGLARSALDSNPSRVLDATIIHHPRSRTNIDWRAGLVALFFALSLLKTLQHVLWRDEWQAWLIARGSKSLAQLLQNRRFEETPLLWHLCLYVLSRLSESVIAMKLFHLGIATGGVAIIVYLAPWRPLWKVLYTFGYFPFFEYSTLNRSYVLTLFFALLATACYCRKRQTPILFAVIIAILLQTTAYGLMFGCLAFGGYALKIAVVRCRQKRWMIRPVHMSFAAVLVAASAGISVLSQVAPKDSMADTPWRRDADRWTLGDVLSKADAALLPVPQFKAHFWNSAYLDDYPMFGQALALAIVLAWSALFIRKPAALFLWSSGCIAMVAFGYLCFLGWQRHWGNLWILLVCCLWIAETSSPTAASHPMLDRYRGKLFTVFLVIHCVAGCLVSVWSSETPFSASQEAAAFIANNFPPSTPVIVDPEWLGTAISGYLGRPFFCTSGARTFTVLDSHISLHMRPNQLIATSLALAHEQPTGVVVVVNDPLPLNRPDFQLVRGFSRSIVTDEHFYVFYVSPKK